MNKLRNILMGLSLLLFASCDSDDLLSVDSGNDSDDQSAPQGQVITIRAEVDPGAQVRAGVEEGNSDFAAGEKFYWEEGDEIKLIFVKLDENEKEPVDEDDENYPMHPTTQFSVKEVKDDKSKADFEGTLPGGIADGTYNVYACSPDIYQAGLFPVFSGSLYGIQNQLGKSSRGLYAAGFMSMWSHPVEKVAIAAGELVSGEADRLRFSLFHLNTMMRFKFSNETDKALTVTQVKVTNSSTYYFIVQSYLSIAPDSKGWEPSMGSSSSLTLNIEQHEEQATMAGKKNNVPATTFDAYMMTPPTSAMSSYETLSIEVQLKDQDDKSYLRKGVISNKTSDFEFLFSEGMEAGNRYYFDMELTDGNVERIYEVGDIYSEEGVPIGVVCQVNAGGKSGTILSLDETITAVEWSTLTESTGAISSSDGKGNTDKIAALDSYKANSSSYPAFQWCLAKGDGWYLPAYEEWLPILSELTKFKQALIDCSGATALSGIYWMSDSKGVFETVEVDTDALCLDIDLRVFATGTRDTPYNVRAMKKFVVIE